MQLHQSNKPQLPDVIARIAFVTKSTALHNSAQDPFRLLLRKCTPPGGGAMGSVCARMARQGRPRATVASTSARTVRGMVGCRKWARRKSAAAASGQPRSSGRASAYSPRWPHSCNASSSSPPASSACRCLPFNSAPFHVPAPLVNHLAFDTRNSFFEMKQKRYYFYFSTFEFEKHNFL